MNTINKIKEIRQKHKLTQQELAKMTKTTQATISALENGWKKAGLIFLTRLKDTLNARFGTKYKIDSFIDTY